MKPKCPFKTAGFDQPDTCDGDCAWLMVSQDGTWMACAAAINAQGAVNDELTPANYWNGEGE